MRSFIALNIPANLEEDVASLARQLKASVKGKYVPRENYHLTLAFLGDAGEREIADALAVLDEASTSFAGIELRSDGLGKFGRSQDATLWLGFAQDPALMDLAAFVREGLATRHVGYDPKPFLPHLTLARRAALPHDMLPELVFPAPTQADEVSLFKSTLAREGATYDPIYTVQLGN